MANISSINGNPIVPSNGSVGTAQVASGYNLMTDDEKSKLGAIQVQQGGGVSVDLTGYLKSADAKATYAPKSHEHAMADVTGLQAALDGIDANLTDASTTASGLMSAADKAKLDGIDATNLAPKSHKHAIADVTGLQAALDDAESSIAHLAGRLPIYYYTDVPSESSITEKPQLAVIKGGAVYLVE